MKTKSILEKSSCTWRCVMQGQSHWDTQAQPQEQPGPLSTYVHVGFLEEFVFIATFEFSNSEKLLSILFYFYHISIGRVGCFHFRCKFCLSWLFLPPSVLLFMFQLKAPFPILRWSWNFSFFLKPSFQCLRTRNVPYCLFDVSHHLEWNKPSVITSGLLKEDQTIS